MPLRASRSPTRNVETRSRTSSGAASSSALARTDGVNDTDDSELVLRRRGLGLSSTLLGGLKAAYFKATPERFVTPKQIADEIRRLRGHNRSTIYERHAKFNEGDHSCPHHDELGSLCRRLVDIQSRDKDKTEYGAIHVQFLKLYAEDPVLYDLCHQCVLAAPWKDLPPESWTFVSPHSETAEDCYHQWSRLLGSNTFKTNQRSETAQYNCDALKDTFNLSGDAAIEFIPFAMGLEMKNDDLVLLRQIWEYFLGYVVRNSKILSGAGVMDLCFRNIVSSGKPLAYFASPSQLKRITMYLVKHAKYVPFVFSTFFPPPKFESRDSKDPYGARIVNHSSTRNWDIVIASVYAIPFLEAYVKEEISYHFYAPLDKGFHTLSEFIEGEYGRGTPLERTVFAKEESAFIDLYKTVYDAATSYHRVKGVRSKLETSAHRAIVTLIESSLGSMVTGNSSRKGKKDWDVPRSNLIIAHTVDIDRYHKREMLKSFKKYDGYIDVLNDRLRFQKYYQRPDGICNLTYIPQFRNVSYLRRFRKGFEYFITADGLPESNDKILNLWNREIFPGDIAIDTMPLDGKVLTCLRVDNESPFFICTGHYPILAGTDFKTNEPLYVAVVKQGVYSPWYFTTVKNGASTVTYTDEIGEEQTARTFFVLALRHDPIDLPPQDNQRRAGAKDPTGPVYWMEFWPKKDAQYFSDERLRDDRLLEEFLEKLCVRKTDPEECQLQELLSGFD